MNNFSITKYLRNQYLNEARGEMPEPRFLHKQDDAQILLSYLKDFNPKDRFGSGSYNGREGYYLNIDFLDI